MALCAGGRVPDRDEVFTRSRGRDRSRVAMRTVLRRRLGREMGGVREARAANSRGKRRHWRTMAFDTLVESLSDDHGVSVGLHPKRLGARPANFDRSDPLGERVRGATEVVARNAFSPIAVASSTVDFEVPGRVAVDAARKGPELDSARAVHEAKIGHLGVRGGLVRRIAVAGGAGALP